MPIFPPYSAPLKRRAIMVPVEIGRLLLALSWWGNSEAEMRPS